jgi:prevent-host-death family protein
MEEDMKKERVDKRSDGTVWTIPAGEFKTHCLRLMDQVAEQHGEIVITKFGKPVAKLVPVEETAPDSYGVLAGTVTYLDPDLVSPDHEVWDDSPV